MLEDKVDDLKNYSRKNNVAVYEIQFSQMKTH